MSSTRGGSVLRRGPVVVGVTGGVDALAAPVPLREASTAGRGGAVRRT